MHMYMPTMFGDVSETSVLHEAATLKGPGPVIVYFWHVKCPHCPAKLSQLNNLCKIKKFKVMGISLEVDGTFANSFQAMDLTMEIIDELDVKNITHYFMTKTQKEIAKVLLEFKTVPQTFIYNPTEMKLVPIKFDDILAM